MRLFAVALVALFFLPALAEAGGKGGGGYVPPPPPCSSTKGYFCSGDERWYRDANCNTSYKQTCVAGCSRGSCNPECTPADYCVGNDLWRRYASCQTEFIQSCYVCGGDGQNLCQSIPEIEFSIVGNNPVVPWGGSTTLTWDAEGRDSCILTGPNLNTSVPISGSYTIENITVGGTYTITCTSAQWGTDSASVAISVFYSGPATIEFRAVPSIVSRGDDSRITWSATNVYSCTVSGPSFSTTTYAGNKLIENILEQMVYTFLCSSPEGDLSKKATINIVPTFHEI